MKKRLLSVTLMLTLIISIVSCQKETDIVDQSQASNQSVNSSADLVFTEQNFTNNKHSDVFIGNVIKIEHIEENLTFPSFGDISEYNTNLYTVKVEKTYLPFVVSENDTINVLMCYTDKQESQSLYVNELEVGKSYILSGIVQPYNGEPIIVAMGNMIASVSKKGKIVPQSSPSEEMFKGIETIEELEADEDFKTLCKSVGKGTLSTVFYSEESDAISDNKLNADSEATLKQTKEQVIEIIREAIKVDSKVKMNVDYDNTPEDN